MSPIRVGVIGLGRIAQLKHLPLLMESPDYSVEAVCDLSKTVTEALSRRYRIPVATTDYRQLLDGRLDAVFICTTMHEEIVNAAFQRDLAIFVEKPLSWSVEAAKRIAVRARQSKPFTVGFMKAALPVVAELKEGLHDYPPRLVRIHNFGGGLKPYHADLPSIVKPSDLTSQQKKEEESAVINEIQSTLPDAGPTKWAAYRFLLDLLGHDLALVAAVTGLPTRVEASAISCGRGEPAGEWSRKTASEHRILVTSTMRIPNGDLLQLAAGAYFADDREWDEEVTFFGDRNARVVLPFPFARDAAIHVEWQHANVSGLARGVSRPRFSDPFRLQIESFARSIRESQPVLVNADDAAAITALVRSIVASAP